jgi:hypothetical protein
MKGNILRALRIANVVEALRAGRVDNSLNRDPRLIKDAMLIFGKDNPDAPVVDTTDIYQNLDIFNEPVDPYSKYNCIAPPWPEALMCYENKHGNIIIISMTALEWNWIQNKVQFIEDWETPNKLDWKEVHWVISSCIWLGGYSVAKKEHIDPPRGPLHAIQYAVAKDGTPLDLHWTQLLPQVDKDIWEIPNFVLLQTLNFMNCRNVQLIESKHPKHVQKRLVRQGVRLSTVHVTSMSRYSKKSGSDTTQTSVPLHSVRGHFAEYGMNGKGKLFGKYTGRYWIAQHARGSEEFGEVKKGYVIKP